MDDERKFSAEAILWEKGPVVSTVDLEAHKRAFQVFYQKHGRNAMEYSDPNVWKEYIDLLEKMEFYAHFTMVHPDTGEWMIEVECGVGPWRVFDPAQYFTFVKAK